MTQTLEPVAKPFALGGWAGAAAATVTWVGFALKFATIPAAALSLCCASGPRVGSSASSCAGSRPAPSWPWSGRLVLVPLEQLGLLPLQDAFSLPLLLSVPVAVAVAVLRYRLWDLERLVSRTVTYAVVTAVLLCPLPAGRPGGLRAGRGLGEPGRGRGHPGRGRPVPAGPPPGPGPGRPALQPPPLRRRENRRRVRGRLRDQVDLDALHGELLAVVDQTMQPTRASLWLRRAR